MRLRQTRRGMINFSATITGVLILLLVKGARSQQCEPEFAGNRTRGQEIAARACAGCHGIDGQGVSAQFPSLASQSPEYLVKQLKAFKVEGDGRSKRPSTVMAPIVASLSESDFNDLAAYYWTLAPRMGVARDPSRLDLGRRIYAEGDPAEGLPACITCHRPTGGGIRPDFPRLAGQRAEYLDQQLATWLAVRGKPGKLMTMIVPHLQPKNRQAVADYISELH
jgi:cytochrome c553